jgi:hypothetical protein
MFEITTLNYSSKDNTNSWKHNCDVQLQSLYCPLYCAECNKGPGSLFVQKFCWNAKQLQHECEMVKQAWPLPSQSPTNTTLFLTWCHETFLVDKQLLKRLRNIKHKKCIWRCTVKQTAEGTQMCLSPSYSQPPGWELNLVNIIITLTLNSL